MLFQAANQVIRPIIYTEMEEEESQDNTRVAKLDSSSTTL